MLVDECLQCKHGIDFVCHANANRNITSCSCNYGNGTRESVQTHFEDIFKPHEMNQDQKDVGAFVSSCEGINHYGNFQTDCTVLAKNAAKLECICYKGEDRTQLYKYFNTTESMYLKSEQYGTNDTDPFNCTAYYTEKDRNGMNITKPVDLTEIKKNEFLIITPRPRIVLTTMPPTTKKPVTTAVADSPVPTTSSTNVNDFVTLTKHQVSTEPFISTKPPSTVTEFTNTQEDITASMNISITSIKSTTPSFVSTQTIKPESSTESFTPSNFIYTTTNFPEITEKEPYLSTAEQTTTSSLMNETRNPTTTPFKHLDSHTSKYWAGSFRIRRY